MSSKKISEDEIDFREIYTKISQSIILIIVTTSLFTITGFFANTFNIKEYQLNFSIEFGNKSVEGYECKMDSFNLYYCFETPKNIELFTNNEIKLFARNLQSKYNISNLKSSFLSGEQTITAALSSSDIDLLNFTLTKITDYVDLLDSQRIRLRIRQRANHINTLNSKLEVRLGKDSADGKNRAIANWIKRNIFLTNADEYPTSQIRPFNPKSSLINESKVKNTLFGFALGLFISVSISLFRNKKVKK